MQSRNALFARMAIEQEARDIPILLVTVNGQLHAVKDLISAGADVNVQAPGGLKTALHLTAEFNYPSIAEVLIKAHANVNARTRNGTTPLHVAAQNGRVALITMFAKAGATIDVISDIGCTPLHEAAAHGHREAVIKLLALKANPGIKDRRYHLTAANLAQANGHSDIEMILRLAATPQQYFIQTVSVILFNEQKTFSKTSTEYQFIDKLARSIAPIEDGEDVFQKCNIALKAEEYKPLERKLKKMQTLLIDSMTEYTEEKLQQAKLDELKQQVSEGAIPRTRKKRKKKVTSKP